MPTASITFRAEDGTPIAAVVETPADGAPAAWAVIAHCFDCGDDPGSPPERIARAMAERRIGVVRFEFGDDPSSVPHAVGSIRAAAAWLDSTHEAPALLIGHSFGGAAAVLAAPGLPSVRAVATVAAPFEPLANSLAELRVPLLIFHSPADAVIPIDDATRIYTAAHHPKSFISLDGSDHRVSDPADAEYVAGVMAAWSSRYVEMPPPAATLEEVRRENGVAASIGRDRYRTDILARGHGFVVDEPSALGGTDQGPTPYDLVAAALGSCTAITLRMYADHKRWPLDGVNVLVRQDRVHAEDEALGADGEPQQMDRLTREIALAGDLTSEQRERLIEIANRCPVHRTLEGGIRIDTSERDAPGLRAAR